METSNQENTSEATKAPEASESTTNASTSPMEALVWWAMLIIAVIAIPAGAIILASVFPLGGIAQLIAFAIGCWICTWVGMWLMGHSQKFDKK